MVTGKKFSTKNNEKWSFKKDLKIHICFKNLDFKDLVNKIK